MKTIILNNTGEIKWVHSGLSWSNYRLVELQKVDDAIFDIKQQLDSAPRELEQLEHKFFAIEDKRNHILDKLSHITGTEKRLSLEIDDDPARIKKSKTNWCKLKIQENIMQWCVKWTVWKNKTGQEREEKLTLLEELRIKLLPMQKLIKNTKMLKNSLIRSMPILIKLSRENNDKLEVLAKKRYEVSDKIPQTCVYAVMNSFRERLEHPVIVGVRDGICTGCNIAIPPTSFIELQGGKQILRGLSQLPEIDFWEEHFDDPSISGKSITQVTETQTDNILNNS